MNPANDDLVMLGIIVWGIIIFLILATVTNWESVLVLLQDMYDWFFMPPITTNNINNTIYKVPPKRKEVIMQGGFHNSIQRYSNVWVKSLIDPKDESLGYISALMPLFTGSPETHEWRWLSERAVFGWLQKPDPLPPPEPAIFISPGAVDEANRILGEYNAHKKEEEHLDLP